MPLGSGRVPACPPGLPAGRDDQPCLDPADTVLKAGLLAAEVLLGALVLVFAGAGDRPGPPGGRLRGQLSLTHRTRVGLAFGVKTSLGAPGGQVSARQRPQVASDSPQHSLVLRGHPQPGPHPCPGRGSRYERGSDLAQCPAHGTAWGFAGLVSRAAQRSAFSARFRAGRRPYRRAQNDVSASVTSRTRSSSTSSGSKTTSLRPCADKAASTSSVFIRPSRSRCSTTTVCTPGRPAATGPSNAPRSSRTP